MPEKKSQEKMSPLPEMRPSVTEILVANGRSYQPFIRTFSYVGENVTKQNLGTLIGVFEIDDQNEDSAYIVNFLASVAKKEYWSNPRRGAIESFEAALHKINLALAELVKHGNVTWLGKLHGAIGVLEKNNLHFSVTGQAKILLLRNGAFADLSEGLASDESHLHPIKTFVEISSGRLSVGDQILTASPELLALFSIEELTRNALRMSNEQFTQFLKTALVNELDMAGLMVIDVKEHQSVEHPKHEKVPVLESPVSRVNNVFSQSAFKPKKPSEAPSVHDVLVSEQQEKESDYIDTKTGHIYVQGDSPETAAYHPWLETLSIQSEEWLRLTRIVITNQGKNFRKLTKRVGLGFSTLGENTTVLGRRFSRMLRRNWRKFNETRLKRAEERATRTRLEAKEHTPTVAEKLPSVPLPKITDIPRPTLHQDFTEPGIEQTKVSEEASSSNENSTEAEIPDFLKERLATFYQRQDTPPLSASEVAPTTHQKPKLPKLKLTPLWDKLSAKIDTTGATGKQLSLKLRATFQLFLSRYIIPTLHRTRSVAASITTQATTRYRTLPQFYRWGIPIIASVLVFGGAYFIFDSPSIDTPVQAPVATTPTPLPEPGQTNQSMGELTVAIPSLENIVSSLLLNDELYVIMPNGVRTTSGETYALPSGRIQFATAMNDLRLIFVETDRGTLYAWSPITKKFIENSLPVEGQITLSGIGSYLTYLYALDSATDQIYRFPRAEGGFGTGTPWLRESVTIEQSARLSVNETIYLMLDPTTIKGYFRGRASSTFESPSDGMNIISLYTFYGLQNVYGLDTSHHRILIWNTDGRLIRELSHEKFSEGQTISVNEKSGEIFISTNAALLSYKLK